MNSHRVLPLKLLLFLLISTCLLSCYGTAEKSNYLIGVSQCVGSDLWRKTMLEEIRMELSLHPGAKLIYSDANNSSSKQVAQVKQMIEKNIDLLIISPNEAQPLTPIVEEVYNKGIPVIIIDRKTSSGLYTAYVGADNFQIGKMAGEYAGTALKGKGRILEIMGLPGSSPTIERQKGFLSGLRKYKGVEIKTEIYGDWLKDKAKSQLLNVQDDLKNIDLIFAHNDVMAAGSREVLNQMKISHSVKIIGIDASPGVGGGMEQVASKILDASLLYPTGGKEAVTTAFKILNKKSFSKENILQSLVIDSTNVQLMKLQWNKIMSQQKDIEQQQSILEEQQAIFKNQQNVLNVTVVTLALAVVLGGVAFYSLQENRKINRRLQRKNHQVLSQRNQLIEMSEKAEKATEAKLNFFTNMSHEFRTPLTLILSPLEDLMQNDKVMALAHGNLTLINKNVFRLLRLINQLIEYRKIEHGKMKIHASPNNLYDFIKDVIDSFQHTAKKKNIDLRLSCKRPVQMIWFDANMLDKVIFNLLSNALKFTGTNGTIEVSIRNENNSIYVQVKDNGSGMTEEEASHVFEHFYQAGSNTTKGFGLGLSLSKELMLLHHGDIKVSSNKLEGTTFTLKLLCGSDHFSEDEKSLHPLDLDVLYQEAKIYTTDLNSPEINVKPDGFTPIKEQSILVIEDNLDLLNYLSRKLREQYEVFTASNAESAITAAYEQVPDLIISDVVLGQMSGTDLTKKLKADLRTSHIPIILLTAKGSMEQQIKGIGSMADAYIVKPFNFEYLSVNVKNLLTNRFLLKSHYTSDISSANRIPATKSLDRKFLNDFSGLIEQNLSNEKLNVDDICKTIGISRMQLYRKVKALLDCTVSDYILSRRLKKAQYLLVNESHTITEITYMVGFSTPNYFSTVFKSKYGCTPSEFKRSE